MTAHGSSTRKHNPKGLLGGEGGGGQRSMTLIRLYSW